MSNQDIERFCRTPGDHASWSSYCADDERKKSVFPYDYAKSAYYIPHADPVAVSLVWKLGD